MPLHDHAGRRAKVRAELQSRELPALLVSDLTNIRYLTGFTGSNAALLLPADAGPIFATDSRYTVQAVSQVPDVERIITRNTASDLFKRAQDAVGFESDKITVAEFDALTEAAGGVDLRRTKGIVDDVRMIKEQPEIDAIAAACRIADEALAEVIAAGRISPGRTERQVARALENAMYDGGAEAPSFETIVAAGANAAMPHHMPSMTPLKRGDLVKIDFGATVDGYHSDMTRVVVIGTPAQWQTGLHALVRDAQQAGVDAAVPGTKIADVDKAARSVIDDAGHKDHFGHGLGHGVGLDVHEPPILHAKADGTLSAGMAVTVEPGVYLPGRGGVRIEDTVAIGEHGCEVLTRAPKDLVSV